MTDPTRVFIAGHRGMVGSAIARQLENRPGIELVTRTRAELDLGCAGLVQECFSDLKIDQVYLAAARVGGIHANNQYPAEFIHENLRIQTAVIHAAHSAAVSRLLFLGSSCIYPRDASQPIAEEALLSGTLELTNEPYAIAKIAGIKMCESYRRQFGADFRSAMPTNLYGPGDNFSLENSHVLPALLRKAHTAARADAPTLSVWGSGKPRREFMHVDDLARACVHLMEIPESAYWSTAGVRNSHINVGTGTDITIRDLAVMIAEIAGFKGQLEFDASRPDGTPRKLLDISRIRALGWAPSISLSEGIRSTYQWMVGHWDEVSQAHRSGGVE